MFVSFTDLDREELENLRDEKEAELNNVIMEKNYCIEELRETKVKLEKAGGNKEAVKVLEDSVKAKDEEISKLKADLAKKDTEIADLKKKGDSKN